MDMIQEAHLFLGTEGVHRSNARLKIYVYSVTYVSLEHCV